MNTVGLIVYPAADASKTKNFFATLLGTEPYVDSPYYIGFKVGDLEIGIDPNATSAEAIAYVTVADIKAALAALLAAGAEKVQDVTDVSQGLLIAKLKTPDGALIGLRQFPNS